MAKGMTERITDPLLARTVQGIEAQLDPKYKQGYQAVVVAGMKVMFSNETHKILLRYIQEGKARKNVQRAAVDGVTRLIAIIYRESKGRMSIPAAFPAAVTLLCYALEFIEKTTGEDTTEEQLAAATQLLTVSLLKMFKIDQQQLAAGAEYNKRKGVAPADTAEPVEEAPVTPEEGV